MPHWIRDYLPVYGQHGLVTSVSEAQLSPTDVAQERARAELVDFKSQIVRIIHQKNAARITPEMWKDMFDDLYKELLVEDTMTG